MFFGGMFRLLMIPIGDAHDFESSFLVGGQVRIVDNPTGADNADSVVHALRQFRFVIEVRENIRKVRVSFHNC